MLFRRAGSSSSSSKLLTTYILVPENVAQQMSFPSLGFTQARDGGVGEHRGSTVRKEVN